MRLPNGGTIEFLLDGAVATTEIHAVANWIEDGSNSRAQGKKSNGATAVTLVAGPTGARTEIDIQDMMFFNADTAQVALTVREALTGQTGTPFTLAKFDLAVGDCLYYTRDRGWQKLNSSGIIGTTATTDSSTADSKAVSAGTRASVADSKAVSVSGNTSIADSKGTSAGTAASTADSKGVSAGTAASVADSKALSVSVQASTGLSTAGSAGTAASVADSKAVSDSVLISSLTSRVSSKGG